MRDKKPVVTSRKHVEELPIKSKTEYYPCGESLFVRVQSKKNSGAKAFVGKMRHPITGKQIEYTVESITKESKLKVKEAVQKWIEIRAKAKEEKCDPNDFKKFDLRTQKNLKDAVENFLSVVETKVKPTTAREYQLKLRNQLLPLLGGDTPLIHLEWRNHGQYKVQEALKVIRGKEQKYELEHRCRSLLNRVFKMAEDNKWIERGQNPVTTNKDSLPTRTPTHHPKLEWHEIPPLLEKIQINKCNAAQQVVLSLKLILLTALRTGAATRLEWDWIDFKADRIEIPPTTSGLKRMKGLQMCQNICFHRKDY